VLHPVRAPLLVLRHVENDVGEDGDKRIRPPSAPLPEPIAHAIDEGNLMSVPRSGLSWWWRDGKRLVNEVGVSFEEGSGAGQFCQCCFAYSFLGADFGIFRLHCLSNDAGVGG